VHCLVPAPTRLLRSLAQRLFVKSPAHAPNLFFLLPALSDTVCVVCRRQLLTVTLNFNLAQTRDLHLPECRTCTSGPVSPRPKTSRQYLADSSTYQRERQQHLQFWCLKGRSVNRTHIMSTAPAALFKAVYGAQWQSNGWRSSNVSGRPKHTFISVRLTGSNPFTRLSITEVTITTLLFFPGGLQRPCGK